MTHVIITQEKIRSFFTPLRLRCISVRQIEREAGVPDNTLSHFLKGRRNLNSEHIAKIAPILREFGLK